MERKQREEAKREKEREEKMAKEFKMSGYEIDLELMSVPKLESYTSTFFRYAMQLVSNSNPRWVPKSVHGASSG